MFLAGEITLKSSKPGEKVKLCLDTVAPASSQDGWKVMTGEMNNDNVFKVIRDVFELPSPNSPWGQQTFKLRAEELDSDDASLSAEGTFVIGYFYGGERH